ncbi:uncharacterized protein LOC141685701 [Apium graveolens]|uniref:uncharacterized protein LOC141685701 n=1 Tax=Apium graveolens TaxID=4045 RepID=UPI003D795A06
MYEPQGSKRIKVSESGAYTPEFNADTTDQEVHEVCPIDQKEAIRKAKGKANNHSPASTFMDTNEIKASALEKLALEQYSEYFRMRFDVVGKRGLSSLQKYTTALRMLAYERPTDYVDEYIRKGETTDIDCLVNFVEGINEIFGAEYLRRPNVEDILRLLQMGEARGIPGMIGSIDCMHWEWKNCPVSWKGQFTWGDHGTPTIMLEPVALQDLWIWKAFFGVPGSNNDLNILNQSPLFTDILEGQTPIIEFMVNGTKYNK